MTHTREVVGGIHNITSRSRDPMPAVYISNQKPADDRVYIFNHPHEFDLWPSDLQWCSTRCQLMGCQIWSQSSNIHRAIGRTRQHVRTTSAATGNMGPDWLAKDPNWRSPRNLYWIFQSHIGICDIYAETHTRFIHTHTDIWVYILL